MPERARKIAEGAREPGKPCAAKYPSPDLDRSHVRAMIERLVIPELIGRLDDGAFERDGSDVICLDRARAELRD